MTEEEARKTVNQLTDEEVDELLDFFSRMEESGQALNPPCGSVSIPCS